jgi:ferritin-like metal-binding protein YciE
MKSTTKATTGNGARKSSGQDTATATKKSASKNGSNGRSAAGGSTVKEKSSAASGLRDFFEDSIKDIYWAEKALTKALPKMSKNAESEELAGALDEHLAVTEEHVQRIEQVFELLGTAPRAKKCEAMEGLIKEGESIMQDTKPGPVRDAGIIAACQKIEHYEIATYGTLATHARILGEDDMVALLEQTLEEEKEADTTLTQIAENSINIEASNEDSEEEEEDEEA